MNSTLEDHVRSLRELEEGQANGDGLPAIQAAILLEELHRAVSTPDSTDAEQTYWRDAARVALVAWAGKSVDTKPANADWWSTLPSPSELWRRLHERRDHSDAPWSARYTALLLELAARRPDGEYEASELAACEQSLLTAIDAAYANGQSAEASLLSRAIFLAQSEPPEAKEPWLIELTQKLPPLLRRFATPRTKLTSPQWQEVKRVIEGVLARLPNLGSASMPSLIELPSYADGPELQGLAVGTEESANRLRVLQRRDGSLELEMVHDGDTTTVPLPSEE